eukprot:TRINITY_DN20250_c0_g1_i1.p1 TRINITY_DN20250_c0_g1~~TRINITY_DN20250_c0_g1_i1.p1  ORF type:complete len:546 (-),score=78.77 TRINITY_DN20250_c0_g1_i1:98-1735(-)
MSRSSAKEHDLCKAYVIAFGVDYSTLEQDEKAIPDTIHAMRQCLDELQTDPHHETIARAQALMSSSDKFIASMSNDLKRSPSFGGTDGASTALTSGLTTLTEPSTSSDGSALCTLERREDPAEDEHMVSQNPSSWDPFVVGVWTWFLGGTETAAAAGNSEVARPCAKIVSATVDSLRKAKSSIEVKYDSICEALRERENSLLRIKGFLTGNRHTHDDAITALCETLAAVHKGSFELVLAFGHHCKRLGETVSWGKSTAQAILDAIEERSSDAHRYHEPCVEAARILCLGARSFAEVERLVQTIVATDTGTNKTRQALFVLNDIICACLAPAAVGCYFDGVTLAPLFTYIKQQLLAGRRDSCGREHLSEIMTPLSISMLSRLLEVGLAEREAVNDALRSCHAADAVQDSDVAVQRKKPHPLERLGDLAAEGNRVAFEVLCHRISVERWGTARCIGAVQLSRMLEYFGAQAGVELSRMFCDRGESHLVRNEVEHGIKQHAHMELSSPLRKAGPWDGIAAIKEQVEEWPYVGERPALLNRFGAIIAGR